LRLFCGGIVVVIHAVLSRAPLRDGVAPVHPDDLRRHVHRQQSAKKFVRFLCRIAPFDILDRVSRCYLYLHLRLSKVAFAFRANQHNAALLTEVILSVWGFICKGIERNNAEEYGRRWNRRLAIE
jgi:hypothetical protein